MMVTWSPHSGNRPHVHPKAAVDYMLDPSAIKIIDGLRTEEKRDLPPELLLGDSSVFLRCLPALRGKHRYSFVTLSFHADDVSVDAFNAGDAALRQKLGQTLRLFFEIAWAGILDHARIRPLVGTHTHTGRLEVNIMMARAVRNADGNIRSYNPHYPRRGSSDIWSFFTEFVNSKFQWADPLAIDRRKTVRLSSKLLKEETVSKRNGKSFDISVPKNVVKIASDIIRDGVIKDRKGLIHALRPALDKLKISVVQLREHDVVFMERANGRKWELSGICLQKGFQSDTFMTRHLIGVPDARLYAKAEDLRREQTNDALSEMHILFEDRAKYNAERYRLETQPTPSLEQMLLQPGLELTPCPRRKWRGHARNRRMAAARSLTCLRARELASLPAPCAN